MTPSTTCRSLRFCFVAALVLAACTERAAPPAEPAVGPWTHLSFLDQPGAFQFAVVGDRAGGHRPGVFQGALDRLEALGPAFVMSVGDLLDTRDFRIDPGLITERAVADRWAEFDALVGDLPMPFFYVPGNNELRNPQMEDIWLRRFGQTYYHFVYQGALFVVLNSEDPPASPAGALGDDQLAWLHQTLADNDDVRWTFLFLHKPMWLTPDHQIWAAVEEALGDRPRTVFGGHTHRYSRSEVNGHTYYGLATTGGASGLSGVSDGSFDHVVWVTMANDGPRIVNLMLDGMWGDDPASEVGK